MNYSEMTDFEINKAVGEITLEGKWACKPGCAGHQSDSWHYGSVDAFVTPYSALPEYCNSWSEAGPIIEKNRISLEFDGDDVAQWCHAISCDGLHRVEYQSNPLRAAMIVFLMMQEKANE